jgi:hypothetical protein
MNLPQEPFFVMGMGRRRKLLYSQGRLSDALTGATLRTWDVASVRLTPSAYCIEIETLQGRTVRLWEDPAALWMDEGREPVCLSVGPVCLPDFGGSPHAALLRALHQEILVNIVNGAPLPNLMVYDQPWYRDGAMVCMCLQRTGNLGLVDRWIMGLREPYDRNNAGEREPDNLGELLYLISLVSDARHPLVPTVLRAARESAENGHLVGRSDFGPHPVYQTKWLKYGLSCLQLDDPYRIPPVYDSYSALFWMDYCDAYVPGAPFGERTTALYPYLGWAEAHFHGWPLPPPIADSYPLTWEAEASQARYAGMEAVGPTWVERRIAAPHTWHAAEMMLYLLAQGRGPST